ncbi:solute carrier family 23 member 1-like isoform X2 [Oratosquilla oratoria]
MEGERRVTKKTVAKSCEALVDPNPNRLLYTVEDSPPWYHCIFLGMQHYLMMVESAVSIPYLLTPLMCMATNDPARSSIASTIIFVSGLVTLMQTTLGVRLPIVQGGTHGFLVPTIAILALRPCPSDAELDAMTSEERQEVWQIRMREVQGAICVSAIFQVVVGFTGIIGQLLRFLTPLAITPTIALIGLSLYPVATDKASSHWGIAVLTMVSLVIFSQYLSEVTVPFITYSKDAGFHSTRIYIFKLFPVLLAIMMSWLLCVILTYSGALSEDSEARTDIRQNILIEAPWFYFPYPFQWGLPTVTLAGVIGMMAGVWVSIVESIGDYYACARLAGAPPPPVHAVNRGIAIEGIGCILAGIWGSGNGTTSYSQNIGAIGVTKVGSRRVIQYSAAIMILFGIIGKVGAFFITIPEPIVGGIFCIVFAMIAAVGLSSLQFVELNSSRNLFVLGFSMFFGLAIPMWFNTPGNDTVVDTGSLLVNQVLLVLLKTSMFVGGLFGFILDNTVPGTDQERGLIQWREQFQSAGSVPSSATCDASCYNLPFGMHFVKRWYWTRFFPTSPTFMGWGNTRRPSIMCPQPQEEQNKV